jgi:hypothetical protein
VSDVDETKNTDPEESTAESTGDIASDPTSVLVTDDVDPATVEEVKDQMEREHFAQTASVDTSTFSPEFHSMFNNAFGIPNSISTVPVNAVEMSADEANIEPVAGTDGYSVSIKVPDNPSGLIINENPVPITEPNTLVSVDEATSVVTVPEDKPTFSNDSLLSAIRNSAPGMETNGTVTGPISTGPDVQTEAPPVKKEEYALSEDNFKAAVKALTDWIKEYFPDMKLRLPISKRFIANIPKDVIDAHFDAVAKYELHPIMSPLFYYIPSLAEDPFMEMGEFINFVVTEATNNDNSIDIMESIDKRKEYYEKFADEDEESDDEVEDDPDCPPDEESEEETKD